LFIDAYLFLNSEEMSDLLNTVINRAVRYYGVIHDIILEILEILSGRQNFAMNILKTSFSFFSSPGHWYHKLFY
jgi:hypothetical protein